MRRASDLVEGWDRDRTAAPDKTRIILTHTNDEVAALNSLARGKLRDGQELGLDVGIRVERGDRTFASGDRVMFLKNDRGLGIKNGSLGVVETVTAKDMTVRLDAGRSVAFDLKDYAHLDHGYAATIHKAQGVTVDRVHVLATPGLDRHAAYVALSRHRDSVQLHYGRDDFADDAKLARVLSRERAKDMASDYERDIGAPSSRKTESAKKEPERTPAPERGQQQSIFSSFRPMAKAPEPIIHAQGTDRGNARNRQEAVRRYARSILAITRMEEQELPVLPHQRQADERARAALDAIRPHAAHDLDSAFERDPALVREAADGRTQARDPRHAGRGRNPQRSQASRRPLRRPLAGFGPPAHGVQPQRRLAGRTEHQGQHGCDGQKPGARSRRWNPSCETAPANLAFRWIWAGASGRTSPSIWGLAVSAV